MEDAAQEAWQIGRNEYHWRFRCLGWHSKAPSKGMQDTNQCRLGRCGTRQDLQDCSFYDSRQADRVH